MAKIKYKLGATVPVIQYGNLMPEIEMEADSIEEAEAVVLPYIEGFFNRYSEKHKIGAEKRKVSTGRVKLTDLFGNEIFYDDATHEYTNSLGEIYLSGSQYAKDEEFDSEYWANYFVENYDLDPDDKQNIIEMWSVNGNASTSFGTALHAAIELYGKYRHIADIIDIDLKTGQRKKKGKIEKNSALSKLPYLQDVVKKFYNEERSVEKTMYEVLVVDHATKRAGRIDRLVVTDDGKYKIRDMKTNHKILKPERDTYSKQLSFYGDIIIANGRELAEENPILIHHWTGDEWVDIPLEKVNTL